MKRFIKKPVVIEAVQWNGNSNKQEIEQFVGREIKSELESETAYVAEKGKPVFSLLIETKEGVMKAFKGDWIIKEPFPTDDRGFYPCKPDIFQKTYEEIIPINNCTQYEQDNTTSMNCKHCGKSKWMHIGY